jgi:bifunctional non-homologous end joining protein LigD
MLSVTTLAGANVVITGKIPGETRTSAEEKVAAAGAHVQRGVTKATDILITGDDVGRVKTEKARQLGVATIGWGDAVALMHGTAVTPTEPPTAAPTRNRPVPATQTGYRQVKPMLCLKTEVEDLPTGEGWLYEVKWDGYRAVAHVNGETQLASRQGKDLNRFEHIKAELDRLVVPCILDGEIVCLDDDGNSNFQALHAGDTSAKFVVFDVLEAQGVDVRNEPLHKRRELLASILEDGIYVTESPIFESGAELLEYARQNDLEGIVAKRAESVYKEGARNANWLKIKLRCEQEFVVVGYTEGEGNRAGTAGAFLLAVNDGTKTKPKWGYCGSAGSGGTYDDFERIVDQLVEVDEPPVESHDLTKAELRKVTWVKPVVVLQIKFQRWTDDGKLWHPSIQGMRDDKKAVEVGRSA